MNPLKTLAKSRRLSLKEVAILSGIKCQQIYHISQGRVFPLDDAIEKIATALQTNPSQLKNYLIEYHQELRSTLVEKVQGETP